MAVEVGVRELRNNFSQLVGRTAEGHRYDVAYGNALILRQLHVDERLVPSSRQATFPDRRTVARCVSTVE